MISLVPPLSAVERPTRLFSANTFLSVRDPPRSAPIPAPLLETVVDSTVRLPSMMTSMPSKKLSTLQFLMIVLLAN